MNKEEIARLRIALSNPNQFQIGDWGRAVFSCKSGVPYSTKSYGKIFDMDAKFVAFVDNDNIEYIIPRRSFVFVKLDFKIKEPIKKKQKNNTKRI